MLFGGVSEIKLIKGKALRKHSLHEKTALSDLLKLFISSNEWCHTKNWFDLYNEKWRFAVKMLNVRMANSYHSHDKIILNVHCYFTDLRSIMFLQHYLPSRLCTQINNSLAVIRVIHLYSHVNTLLTCMFSSLAIWLKRRKSCIFLQYNLGENRILLILFLLQDWLGFCLMKMDEVS